MLEFFGLVFLLRPNNFKSLYIGKSNGSLLPRLDAMTLSKNQARMAKSSASAKRIPIDYRSEYLSKVPPPNGSGPAVVLVKTSVL